MQIRHSAASELITNQSISESCINKLNTSNKTKEEATIVFFYIDQQFSPNLKFFVGISKTQKILLCESDKKEFWRPSESSGFSYFEEFVANFLNYSDYNDSNLTQNLNISPV